VVVTYDDNGFYGHPDHIQAHGITVAERWCLGLESGLEHLLGSGSTMSGSLDGPVPSRTGVRS
jgi:hypothetical protein